MERRLFTHILVDEAAQRRVPLVSNCHCLKVISQQSKGVSFTKAIVYSTSIHLLLRRGAVCVTSPAIFFRRRSLAEPYSQRIIIRNWTKLNWSKTQQRMSSTNSVRSGNPRRNFVGQFDVKWCPACTWSVQQTFADGGAYCSLSMLLKPGATISSTSGYWTEELLLSPWKVLDPQQQQEVSTEVQLEGLSAFTLPLLWPLPRSDGGQVWIARGGASGLPAKKVWLPGESRPGDQSC